MMHLPYPRLLVVAWAVASVSAAVLPPGVGATPRAVNSVLFLCCGPGVAVVAVLGRSVGYVAAVVTGIAASLSIPVLCSQLLVAIGAWTAPAVAVMVGVVTVGLVLLPSLPRARSEA